MSHSTYIGISNKKRKQKEQKGDASIFLLMAEFFGKSVSTVNEYIKNIYSQQELLEAQTMKKFRNYESAKKPTNYYSLDMIKQLKPGSVTLGRMDSMLFERTALSKQATEVVEHDLKVLRNEQTLSLNLLLKEAALLCRMIE